MRLFSWQHGWNVIAAAILIQAVLIGISFFSFTFWVVPLMQEFGASRRDVMFSVLAMQFAAALLAPWAGRSVDRFPAYAIIISAAFALALGLVLAAHARALWQVILIYGSLMAYAQIFGGEILGQVLAARWFHERRGRALGLVSIGTSIGGVLMPPLVTTLIVAYGWRDANQILAVFALVVVIPLAMMVLRHEAPLARVEARVDAPVTAPALAPAANGMLGLLRQSDFLLPTLAIAPIIFAVSSVQVNLGPYTSDLNFSPQQASFIMSAMMIGSATGKLCISLYADRIDHRRIHLLLTALLIPALIVMMGRPGYATLIACVLALGVAVGSSIPLLGAMLSSRLPLALFGRAFALAFAILTLMSLGGPLGGAIRDNVGGYAPFFGLLAACAALGPILITRLRRQR